MKRALDPKGWNEEVLRLGGGFLQSWEWGAFQERAGFRPLRFRDAEGRPSQWLERPMPFGKRYWYCPRAVAPLADDAAAPPEFRGAVFLRHEPAAEALFKNVPAGTKLIRRPTVQPGRTLVLDLTKSEDELLAGMHEKTRYNIRLAERKGVRVYHASGKDRNALRIFTDLMNETTARDRFHAHEEDYYAKMLETLPYAELVFAEHDGKVLAANLMIAFGDTVIYLHGASSRERREVMAPHLMHWTFIKEAKAKGFARYDFWGVAPADQPNHPWAGISRFKRGFGGIEVVYPGSFDLPISKFWYGLYRFVKRLRA